MCLSLTSLLFHVYYITPEVAGYQRLLDINHQQNQSTEETMYEIIINDPLKDITSKAYVPLKKKKKLLVCQ